MDILIYLLVFYPMAAAVLSYLLGRRGSVLRDRFLWVTVAAEFVLSLCLLRFFGNSAGEALVKVPGICGFGLTFTAGGFRGIYVCVAAFMWLITFI